MNGTPQLDVSQIFRTLIGAASGAFADRWPEVERFATREFRTIAGRLVDIAEGVKDGDYDLGTARMLLRMQVNVAAQALAGLTTLTLLMVEDAINRTLEAVKGIVNAVAGALLPI